MKPKTWARVPNRNLVSRLVHFLGPSQPTLLPGQPRPQALGHPRVVAAQRGPRLHDRHTHPGGGQVISLTSFS